MKNSEQCAAKTAAGFRCSRRAVKQVRFTSMLAYWFCGQHAAKAKLSGVKAGGR